MSGPLLFAFSLKNELDFNKMIIRGVVALGQTKYINFHFLSKGSFSQSEVVGLTFKEGFVHSFYSFFNHQ